MTKPKKKKAAPKSSLVVNFKNQLEQLRRHYPDAHCALHFKNPFELLVATILSAQCTDVRVNMVTPQLFHEFPTALALSKAKLLHVEQLIRSTGFFHNKAKNLIACAQRLVELHGGEVPPRLEALIELPGVGRKTANVVLGNAFHINAGIVVDTHVGRLSRRLKWTREKDPVAVEMDLQKWVEVADWTLVSHLLISHGRGPCQARRPACQSCFLFDGCPRVGVQ